MATISVLFTCRGRPNLTELCLRRFLELMPQPFEIILVYDGDDLDYANHLLDFCDFSHVVMNPDRRRTRFALINDGLDACDGDYFMHLENDFYWSKEGTIERALETFEKYPKLDYLRFEFLPFHAGQCQKLMQITEDEVCIFRDGTPFQFTFNPHLRRDKFPIGRFPEEPIKDRQPEGLFAELWDKTGNISGCLMGENFRHIGVYDEGGHYKEYYAERFTLQRGKHGNFSPMTEFEAFCSNPYYRILFKRYLDDNRD